MTGLLKWLDFLKEHPELENTDTIICVVMLAAVIITAIVLKIKTRTSFKDLFF